MKKLTKLERLLLFLWLRELLKDDKSTLLPSLAMLQKFIERGEV